MDFNFPRLNKLLISQKNKLLNETIEFCTEGIGTYRELISNNLVDYRFKDDQIDPWTCTTIGNVPY